MPGIDLSTLSGPDLKRLLKIAQSRNDGPLADRLEWEIASRGGGVGRPGGPFAPPAADDPDEPDALDEPAAPDEPGFRMAAPDAEPFVLEPRTREPASAGGGMLLVSLGLVAGAVLSGGVYWGLQRTDLSPILGSAPAPRVMAARPAAQTASPPAPMQPQADQPAPPPPEPEVPVAAPAAPVEPAVPPATPPVEVAKEAPRREPAPRRHAAAKAERTPRPSPAAVRLAKAEPSARKSASRDACARSTPADRLVCGDLGLRLADFEMREAYVRALNARADPAVTGAGQAAWRRARNEVSDPDRLARLYSQRIRELDAATAAARARRPQG